MHQEMQGLVPSYCLMDQLDVCARHALEILIDNLEQICCTRAPMASSISPLMITELRHNRMNFVSPLTISPFGIVEVDSPLANLSWYVRFYSLIGRFHGTEQQVNDNRLISLLERVNVSRSCVSSKAATRWYEQ